MSAKAPLMPEQKIPLYMLDRPLTSADLFTYCKELAALQGNILKSHGREATVSVFLTFKPGKVKEVKQLIHNLAKSVTSALKQEEQTAAFKYRRKSELLTTFHLTARGYGFLRYDTTKFCEVFREGLSSARKRLTDPPLSEWEANFRRPVHAMVTLAHDYQSQLAKAHHDLVKSVKSMAEVFTESGQVMRRESDGWTIEHFGFVDGISQPLFFDREIPSEKSRDRWNPAAGPNLVLVRDPHGKSDENCGTFLVFRKLEQNVKGFKRAEKALAKRLHLKKDDTAFAGALIVGRFHDGTPVADRKGPMKQPRSGAANPALNDFNYKGDRDGNKCPLFAHTRKTGPRGSSAASLESERSHRIARRGITYGDPMPPGDDEATWPEKGVGLLFQCCQANLTNQFEFIQRRWANNPRFVRFGSGPDALIGQAPAAPISVPRSWGEPARMDVDLERFVRLLGGEYFFTPSIPFLKRI
jgi:Dyp-type peroxidase family